MVFIVCGSFKFKTSLGRGLWSHNIKCFGHIKRHDSLKKGCTGRASTWEKITRQAEKEMGRLHPREAWIHTESRSVPSYRASRYILMRICDHSFNVDIDLVFHLSHLNYV